MCANRRPDNERVPLAGTGRDSDRMDVCRQDGPQTVHGCGVRIRELHSYEEPEIVVVDLTDGSATYLAWLRAQVTAVDPGRPERPCRLYGG